MSNCAHCELPRARHRETWVNEILSHFIPEVALPRRAEKFFDMSLEYALGKLGLLRMERDVPLEDLQPRLRLVLEACRRQGMDVRVGVGPFGITNHACVSFDGKDVRFESLPAASFTSRYSASLANSKKRTKNHLKEGGFSVPEGASFWFWEKDKARAYGMYILGFPLVVKPLGGSVARHVTTRIATPESLDEAMDIACAFAPSFLVERFVENAHVFRATVVGERYVACAMQVPAFVVGDGVSTVLELINTKNALWEGKGLKERTVITETTKEILARRGQNLASVLLSGEVVSLAHDPFMKLGGEVVEVTSLMHPDNKELFLAIARHFDMRVVGMDVMMGDISRSWKEQGYAVLELNSAPAIDMHHTPHQGEPQDVASELVRLIHTHYA